MHISLRLLLIPAIAFLPACSGDEQENAKTQSPFGLQLEAQKKAQLEALEALEKAKQVEKLIRDADEKRRRQMEEQGL
jgi:hypothetical protein